MRNNNTFNEDCFTKDLNTSKQNIDLIVSAHSPSCVVENDHNLNSYIIIWCAEEHIEEDFLLAAFYEEKISFYTNQIYLSFTSAEYNLNCKHGWLWIKEWTEAFDGYLFWFVLRLIDCWFKACFHNNWKVCVCSFICSEYILFTLEIPIWRTINERKCVYWKRTSRSNITNKRNVDYYGVSKCVILSITWQLMNTRAHFDENCPRTARFEKEANVHFTLI